MISRRTVLCTEPSFLFISVEFPPHQNLTPVPGRHWASTAHSTHSGCRAVMAAVTESIKVVLMRFNYYRYYRSCPHLSHFQPCESLTFSHSFCNLSTHHSLYSNPEHRIAPTFTYATAAMPSSSNLFSLKRSLNLYSKTILY